MTKETRARIRGKVESFSGGHGYIVGDDGAVYFAHYTEITDSGGGDDDSDSDEEMPSLSPGTTVEFQPNQEEDDDDDEPAALEIQVVTGD
jgi:cold shock CspA family protein